MNLIKVLVNGAKSVLKKQRRTYHTLKYTSVGPVSRPETKAKAEEHVGRVWEELEDTGALNPIKGTISVISFTEFWLNGHYNNDGDLMADASKPISWDAYKTVRDAFIDKVTTLDPGVVVIGGTAAIDTGDVDKNQKKIGENRGFILSSHDPKTVVEIGKKEESDIDGWTSDFVFRGGDGPVRVAIPDVLGKGRAATFWVSICLDSAISIPKPYDKYLPVDAIISPAAGFPYGVEIPKNSYLLISDTKNFDPSIYRDRVIAWKEVEDKPEISQLIRSIKDSGTVSVENASYLHSTLMSYERLKPYLEPYNKKTIMECQWYPKDNPTPTMLSVTLPMLTGDIPDPVDFIQKTFTQGANLITNFMTEGEVAKAYSELESVGKELPKDYIQKEVKDVINEQVDETLSNVDDPTSLTTEELIEKLDMTAISNAVNAKVSREVFLGMAGDKNFSTFSSKYSVDVNRARYLSDIAISRPIEQGIAKADTSGISYLDLKVKEAVHNLQVGWWKEQSTELQKQYASNLEAYNETTSEIAKKNQTLKQVEAELESKPDNSNLLEQKKQLEEEINRETAKQVEQEQAKEKSASNAKEADEQVTSTEKEATETGKEAQKREGEIFGE